MKPSRRILLLSLKAGAGHIRAARAIEQALREFGTRGECEVRHIEVLEYTRALYRHGFGFVYGGMINRCPSLWRQIYEQTEAQSAKSSFKSLTGTIARISSGPLVREVESFDPDTIVCTHFMPAYLMAGARNRGSLRSRVCVAMTDFDVHPMWIHPGVDQYFVATPEMAFALKQKAGTGAHVACTGIPIFPEFRSRLNEEQKRELRRRLKLDPDRATVLVSGGGCGLGSVDETVKTLTAFFPGAQFLAVAGNNAGLFAALNEIAKSANGCVVPYSFVSNMHELMGASDFAIAKPGGLTSSECLAMGLPMILVNPIPGQEERNENFLLESGAAMSARFAPSLIHKTGLLLNERRTRRRMSLAAAAIAKPDAAEQIAETILGIPARPVLINAPGCNRGTARPVFATAAQ